MKHELIIKLIIQATAGSKIALRAHPTLPTFPLKKIKHEVVSFLEDRS